MKRLLFLMILMICGFVTLLFPFACLGSAKADQNNLPGLLDQIRITIDPDLLWIADSGEIQYISGETGEIAFSEKAGIYIDNELNVGIPQKNIYIVAEGDPFQIDSFSNRLPQAYQSLQLYNGGKDCLWTRLADVVQTEMVERYLNADVLTLSWRPVTVVINGEYWGQYFLREALDHYTICKQVNLPENQAGNIEIFTDRYSANDSEPIKRLKSQIWSYYSFPNEDNKKLLTDMVDMNSFIDWLAIKVFFGDPDPSSLVCYMVPGGKWKVLLTEMEYGLLWAEMDPLSYFVQSKPTVWQILFQIVMKDDEYRKMFLQRIGNIYQTITVEKMQNTLVDCIKAIEQEMPAHFSRWAAEKDPQYLIEVPMNPDDALKYWKKRIVRMWSGTMVKRPLQVYKEVKQYFDLNENDMQEYFGIEFPAWLLEKQ